MTFCNAIAIAADIRKQRNANVVDAGGADDDDDDDDNNKIILIIMYICKGPIDDLCAHGIA